MGRKFAKTIYLSLLLTMSLILLAGTVSGMNQNDKKEDIADILKKAENRRIPLDLYKTYPKARLSSGDNLIPPAGLDEGKYDLSSFNDLLRGEIGPTAGAGLTVGLTTFDLQHYGRCTRQIAWRNTHDVHIVWMMKNAANPSTFLGNRITMYTAWDASLGATAYGGMTPFRQLHYDGRSGFCGADVMSDGRALAYNHYDPDISLAPPHDYYATIWPDLGALAGSFGAYRQSVPAISGSCRFPESDIGSCPDPLWPYAAFQLYDNGAVEDTIIHILAKGTFGEEETIGNDSRLAYWRRTGGPNPLSPSVGWSSMVIDTISTIGYVVECGQGSMTPGYEGKVALVWIAPWPDVPGGVESRTPGDYDLLVDENANDIYGMVSMDGGLTWDNKFNITQNDFTIGGWAPLSDLSALIDTDGRLHVVYAARQFINNNGASDNPADMDWPLFPMASRIFHWSDDSPYPGYATIVKDASFDWTMHDSICFGGQWDMMAVTKPMIAQCDYKLYVMFSQHQDIKNGIWDNCHMNNWYFGDYIGSANSTLHFSVSDDGLNGLTWDASRALTDFTPRCDTAETGNPSVPANPEALSVCHSHGWPSMARYGMYLEPSDDFTNAVVVNDPSWSQYNSPDYYLDVLYVDDSWPGGIVNGEGMWSISPVKWFRLPCVDAEATPVLALDPVRIAPPDWGKPGIQYDFPFRLTNIGNTQLTVSDIRVEEEYGPINGWLNVDERGFGGSIPAGPMSNSFEMEVQINRGGIVNDNNPTHLVGRVIVHSDSPDGADTMSVEFIIADTVQAPEEKIIYTDKISLAVSNDGSYGCARYENFGQMDYHSLVLDDVECDTCSAGPGVYTHKYLYDASPFILIHDGVESRISASIHEMNWLSERDGVLDGLRPLVGLWEPLQFTAYDMLDGGIACTADSTVAMKSTYIAPQTPDTNQFIVQILEFYNLTDHTIDDMYVGNVEDWDIPSDTAVRNTSSFDVDRKMMYMRGWETANDTSCGGITGTQNNCAASDMRYGGSAFFAGFHYKPTGFSSSDKFEEEQGGVTAKTVSWLGDDLRGHLPADRLYDTLNGIFFGYSPWTATSGVSADSIFQDLVLISSFGNYSLGVYDTLTFVKFLASEYDGGLAGLQETIDKAHAFTLHYLCCDIWGISGDVNTDLKVDILDIVRMINFKYKGGDGVCWPSERYDPEGIGGWPTDNCDQIMNVNTLQIPGPAIDILDIVHLINYKYKNGSAPSCPH